MPGIVVQESFAAIWGTEDLLVPFDGGNIFQPWRYNPEWLITGGDFKKRMSRLNFTNIQKMIHSFPGVSFSKFKLSKQRTFEEAGSIVTKMPALALKVKAGVKETDFHSNWIGMDK